MTGGNRKPEARRGSQPDDATAERALDTHPAAAETETAPNSLPLPPSGCRPAAAGRHERPGHTRLTSLAADDQAAYPGASRSQHAAADEVHVIPPPTPPCITPGAARALLHVLLAARDRYDERSSEGAGP